MMKLIKLKTYLLDSHFIELKNVEKWKENLEIRDFLIATQNKSLNNLKKMSYFLTVNLKFLLSSEN